MCAGGTRSSACGSYFRQSAAAASLARLRASAIPPGAECLLAPASGGAPPRSWSPLPRRLSDTGDPEAPWLKAGAAVPWLSEDRPCSCQQVCPDATGSAFLGEVVGGPNC